MTTYTAIPDASLEPGKPARSVDAILLRDNPIAITEGASGAPKIQFDALDSWYTTAGAIGTYALLLHSTNTDYNFGSTKAGSGLFPAGIGAADAGTFPVFGTGAALLSKSSTAASGTWRCMGIAPYTGTQDNIISLWVRIS